MDFEPLVLYGGLFGVLLVSLWLRNARVWILSRRIGLMAEKRCIKRVKYFHPDAFTRNKRAEIKVCGMSPFKVLTPWPITPAIRIFVLLGDVIDLEKLEKLSVKVAREIIDGSEEPFLSAHVHSKLVK